MNIIDTFLVFLSSDSPGVPPSATAHELFRGFSYIAPTLKMESLNTTTTSGGGGGNVIHMASPPHETIRPMSTSDSDQKLDGDSTATVVEVNGLRDNDVDNAAAAAAAEHSGQRKGVQAKKLHLVRWEKNTSLLYWLLSAAAVLYAYRA